MPRLLRTAYGLVAYILFLVVFLYAVGFVGNLAVPKGIDDGETGSMLAAVVANLALLSLFAVQHSVMARPAFKAWLTRFVPPAIERSSFVLAASLALALLFWQWRPMPAVVWQATSPAAELPLTGLFWLGWLIVLASTFMISHFELFGLRQVMAEWSSRARAASGFQAPGFYRLVRHPIYVGFIIAFWAAPTMTLGHLLFAAVTTAYIMVGIKLEERDLVGVFGGRYLAYRRQVGMLVPRLGRRAGEANDQVAA